MASSEGSPTSSPASAAEDATLVAALRAGDELAAETMVRSHGPRMLAVAKRILRHEEDAHDAVQDAFVSAFKAIDRFQGDARLSTWLHRIAVNAALMRLRKRKAKSEQSIDALLPRFADNGHRLDPGDPWPEAGEEHRENRHAVRDAIDKLPEIYSNVLILRDIEGLDTREAAEALEVSESAVKVRLHRARQALRSLLEEAFA